MAVAPEKIGAIKIKIDSNTFLCARTVSFGGAAEKKDVSCVGSGGVEESRPGKKSYTLTAEGLIRVATGTDVATQVTSASLEAAFEAGTVFDWEYGSDTPGATVRSGTAYVLSFEETAPFDDEPTFNVTFGVTGSVTYTTNPA